MNAALFIRHRAKSGLRDAVRRVWEKHVKPRALANPDHLAYYFCFDETDDDVICVFQLYRNKESMAAFLSGDWYPGYLADINEVVADAPQVMPASLVWAKSSPANL
ncbi:MAG: hypothetical protein R3F19_18060 [Verrucomicrobiales bacterium]